MMMNKPLYSPKVLFSLDAVAIFTSWYLAYLWRFEFVTTPLFSEAQQGLQFTFIKMGVLNLIITLYIFSRHGLYREDQFTSLVDRVFRPIKSSTVVFFILIFLLYFILEERLSRLMLLFYFTCSTSLIALLRLALNTYFPPKENFFSFLSFGGEKKNLADFIKQLQLQKNLKVKEIPVPHNISLHDLRSLIEKEKPTVALLSVEDFHKNWSSSVGEVIDLCQQEIIDVKIIPSLPSMALGQNLHLMGNVPYLSINSPDERLEQLFLKRALDVVGSFLGLIFLSPLLFLLMILIKLTSKGPIFYGQERIGLNGVVFKMWKFRSMKIDAEKESGAVWCKEDDPRRTKFGSFLRKSSLDELPQLWNVLRGEMTLVGPRPERPMFVHQFKKEIPDYMLRHKMKAGMTGLAQINGLRGDTSLEERIKYDLLYIKNYSFYFDIKIKSLILTIWKGLFHHNAY